MKRTISILIFLLSLAMAVGASAQNSVISLQQSLDRPVSLDVNDAPIAEVFKKLTENTGVIFMIEPETADYLPYGDQTRLAVTLRNVTLRNALSPMLAPQALTWEIEGDRIHIRPSEPLYRLARRATFDELSLLGKLLSEKLPVVPEGESVIAAVREKTGQSDLKIFFEGDGADEALEKARVVLPASPAEWLDMACRGQGWTWYLEETRIQILPKARQTQRQLELHVSLKYQNRRLVDVLLDLARKGRVKLMLDPGVMNLLPVTTRENFNLMMSDATLSQALEVISGATGLEFTVTDEGLHVDAGPTMQKSMVADSSARTPYFVLMTIDGPSGEKLQVFMKPEELPQDVQEKIETAKRQFIEKIRGDQPASEPAPQN
jgi:hypothetical protein